MPSIENLLGTLSREGFSVTACSAQSTFKDNTVIEMPWCGEREHADFLSPKTSLGLVHFTGRRSHQRWDRDAGRLLPREE